MPNPISCGDSPGACPGQLAWRAVAVLTGLFLASGAYPAETPTPLRERLAATSFKIAYEAYLKDNAEIFVMNADGSHPVNLTRTPNDHEHYPQVSPDGTKICFVSDRGEGRESVRSLCVMDIDGGNRRTIANGGREPFWRADSRVIGFLHQEFPKFHVMDYATRGMSFFDLATGRTTAHPNTTNLFHLYNPGFSPDGKWIVATVNAGMGQEHAILAIEADGARVVNLGIPGCRPTLSPDGREIAWAANDHEIAVAPIDLRAPEPKVAPRRLRIQDAGLRIIHVDWSPDGRFLSFSRGPDGQGDPAKRGTFLAAAGIVGVYAAGWNLAAVAADRTGILDLPQAGPEDFVMLTTDGCSNKEPDWFKGK